MTQKSHNHHDIIIIGGGQSGLTAAKAAEDEGLQALVLEAGDRAVGSWPRYYDSLKTFSPRRFSSIPDFPHEGDPDGYPSRNDIAEYLEKFSLSLRSEIRTGVKVNSVTNDAGEFTVHTSDGEQLKTHGLIAASGSFDNPHVPIIPGHANFTGHTVHVADYRSPESFAGQRVVVVGGGNSAIQVGVELANHATTTVASRHPVMLLPQQTDGKDLHHHLVSGLDYLPASWIARLFSNALTIDIGNYRDAFESGLLDFQQLFTEFDGDSVVWPNGTRERVDAVIFATGYRPHLSYLQGLGALDDHQNPLHSSGLSLTHPGLAYLGVELQRSFASNTLRGVLDDARSVMKPLAAFVRGRYALPQGHLLEFG